MCPALRSRSALRRRPGRWVGAVVVVSLSTSLAACPASAPYSSESSPSAKTPARDPAPPSDVLPAPETPPPAPSAAPPAADSTMPDALAGPGVSPVAAVLWRALRDVSDGDPDAMSRALLPAGRWYPPGRPEESVGGPDELRRAMQPWSSPTVHLDLRRVLALGSERIAAQLAVSDSTRPDLRFEIALVVDAKDGRIASVRQYGAPLGPVRARAEDAGATLDLAPPGEISVVVGSPKVAHVAATKRLVDALDGRDGAAIREIVGATVLMHDVQARRTRRGPDAFEQGYWATLGEHGRFDLLHHHAVGDLVLLEGTIYGRETGEDGTPWEHGFADVHRFEGGAIVETWHYVNRRGRPRVEGRQATLVRP